VIARYRRLLAEIRQTHPPEKRADEKRSDFFAFLIYRPVSFLVTPLFLLLGFSADGVTAIGFGIAVAMPAAAWIFGAGAAGWVAGLGVAMMVLDCVDGSIARVTGRSSPVGGMLDGCCTLLFWAGYFVAVGALAYAPEGGFVARHGREIGLALAVLLLTQRGLEDAFDACTRERVRWEPPLPGAIGRTVSLANLGRPVEQLAAFGGLAVAGALGKLAWFAGGVALYECALFALWLPRYVRAVAASSRGGR
jgi:phosphatidylglycerophosphate synthase